MPSAREALRACRGKSKSHAAEGGSGYASPTEERAREVLRACRDKYNKKRVVNNALYGDVVYCPFILSVVGMFWFGLLPYARGKAWESLDFFSEFTACEL